MVAVRCGEGKIEELQSVGKIFRKCFSINFVIPMRGEEKRRHDENLVCFKKKKREEITIHVFCFFRKSDYYGNSACFVQILFQKLFIVVSSVLFAGKCMCVCTRIFRKDFMDINGLENWLSCNTTFRSGLLLF